MRQQGYWIADWCFVIGINRQRSMIALGVFMVRFGKMSITFRETIFIGKGKLRDIAFVRVIFGRAGWRRGERRRFCPYCVIIN